MYFVFGLQIGILCWTSTCQQLQNDRKTLLPGEQVGSRAGNLVACLSRIGLMSVKLHLRRFGDY